MARLCVLAVFIVVLSSLPAHAVTFLANELPDTLHVSDSPFWVIGPAWTASKTVVVEAGCDLRISTSSNGLLVSSGGALRFEGTSSSRITLRPLDGHAPSSLVRSDAPYTVQALYIAGTDFVGTSSRAGLYLPLGPGCNTTFQMALTLDDCSFRSFDYGIQIEVGTGTTTPPTFTNCWFYDCNLGLYLFTCSNSTASFVVTGGGSVGCGAGISAGFSSQTMIGLTGFVASDSRPGGDGVSLSVPAEVTGCTFTRCFRGVYARAANIVDCDFRQDTTAIYIDGEVACAASRFVDSVVRDVECRTSVGIVASVDFRGNNWGPLHTAELDSIGFPANASFINDWWDDSSYAIVDYSGWQDAATGVPEPPQPRSEQRSWGAVKALFK